MAKAKKTKMGRDVMAFMVSPPQEDAAPPPAPMPTELQVRYLRSNFHRVIHVDGVYGGPTTGALIHIAVYSERSPVPTEQKYDINQSGIISEHPKATVGAEGVVREIEASLMLSVPMASSLIGWLQNVVRNAEIGIEAMKSVKASENK